MECPYCNYMDWVFDANKKSYEGEQGRHFVLSNEIIAERNSGYSYGNSKETRQVFGCAKCRKVFIGD